MAKTLAAGITVLDATFRGTSLHPELWAALALADGTEITGGNAARVRIYQDGSTSPFVDPAADDGNGVAACTNNGVVLFPEDGGGEVAAKVLLYTAQTGGVQVREMDMTTPIAWDNNVIIRFRSGTLIWKEQ